MKTVSMSGSLRENVGKKDAKKHRREGNIPCVLYGGKEQIHFTLSEKDFSRIIFTPEVFILSLSINDKQYTTILQDVQYHPVTDVVLHVDFLEVIPGKPVIIGLPVKFKGNPPGVLKGGRLQKRRLKLIAKGLIEDLPDFIEVDISGLDLNENVKVGDISMKGLEFLDPATSEIVGVKTSRGAGMAEEEEEVEEAVEGAEGGEEGEGAEAKDGGESPQEEGGDKAAE
jgi:large subunit ribosomal protein L25